MAHGAISDKSRRFSLLALQELERISGRHPVLPDPAALGEDQAAWLSERMRSFHESVVQTGWRRFSFLPESKAVRNSLAHSTADCTQEERGCYLISFSTGIEVQDMSLFKRKDGLKELVKFLRKSFNGGTDAAPALRHGLELMGSKDWKRADLLLVSDFVMDGLSQQLVDAIKEQQGNGTRFFSLVIGESGNTETISCFDENWCYDPSARGSMAHLVRQLGRLHTS